MISAEIPVSRMISTADLSLSLPDFIDYSIKNDLNIVTTSWLAHSKKIPIAASKEALMLYWNSIGKNNGYFATFSCLIGDFKSGNGLKLELLDSTELTNYSNIMSCEIYALHAVPLKDKAVQFGMINVPISCESDIKAPWIVPSNPNNINQYQYQSQYQSNQPPSVAVNAIDTKDQSIIDPPIKKLRIEEEVLESGTVAASSSSSSASSVKPAADTGASKKPAPPKQSNMMSFFKKK